MAVDRTAPRSRTRRSLIVAVATLAALTFGGSVAAMPRHKRNAGGFPKG